MPFTRPESSPAAPCSGWWWTARSGRGGPRTHLGPLILLRPLRTPFLSTLFRPYSQNSVPPSPARPPFLTRCFEQRVVVDGKIVSQLCDENGTLHLAQFQQAMRKQVRRRIAPRCCSPVRFLAPPPSCVFGGSDVAAGMYFFCSSSSTLSAPFATLCFRCADYCTHASGLLCNISF